MGRAPQQIIAEMRAFRPQGWLTPEDEAFSQLIQSRLSGATAAAAKGARYDAIARVAQRGLAGSGLEDRQLARIGQMEAGGRERAAGAASELLQRLRTGREAFAGQAGMASYGAELKDAYRNQDRADRKKAAFWNSWLPVLSQGISMFAPGAGALRFGAQQMNGGGGGEVSSGMSPWATPKFGPED